VGLSIVPQADSGTLCRNGANSGSEPVGFEPPAFRSVAGGDLRLIKANNRPLRIAHGQIDMAGNTNGVEAGNPAGHNQLAIFFPQRIAGNLNRGSWQHINGNSGFCDRGTPS
jgi:hypothetical protein